MPKFVNMGIRTPYPLVFHGIGSRTASPKRYRVAGYSSMSRCSAYTRSKDRFRGRTDKMSRLPSQIAGNQAMP